MEYIRPFGPKPTNAQNTVNAAVAVTNTSLALVGTPGQGYQSVRIFITGATAPVFVNFSTGAGTASSANDMPMTNTSGKGEIFWLPKPITHVNFISANAAGTVYATVGEGI